MERRDVQVLSAAPHRGRKFAIICLEHNLVFVELEDNVGQGEMGARGFGAVVASRDTGGRRGGRPFRRSIDSRRERQALCLEYLDRETTWFEG